MTGKAATNYLAAEASDAGAAAGAAEASAAGAGAATGAGAAGAAASSFLPQADKAAAAMMAAKTRDLFMMNFPYGGENNFRKLSKQTQNLPGPRKKHSSTSVLSFRL
jgi:hypothetical protein